MYLMRILILSLAKTEYSRLLSLFHSTNLLIESDLIFSQWNSD